MQLIYTKEYALLVDKKAKVKINTILVDAYNIVYKVNSFNAGIPVDENGNGNLLNNKVVVSYYPLTKEAKELDLPLLPNSFIDKSMDILYEDIDKHEGYEGEANIWSDDFYSIYRHGFQKGYKAAQSKQFSLEDMYKLIDILKESAMKGKNLNLMELAGRDFIESLSTQQLPKEFIPEYKIDKGWQGEWVEVKDIKLKMITNSEGKQELVGKYKY